MEEGGTYGKWGNARLEKDENHNNTVDPGLRPNLEEA